MSHKPPRYPGMNPPPAPASWKETVEDAPPRVTLDAVLMVAGVSILAAIGIGAVIWWAVH